MFSADNYQEPEKNILKEDFNEQKDEDLIVGAHNNLKFSMTSAFKKAMNDSWGTDKKDGKIMPQRPSENLTPEASTRYQLGKTKDNSVNVKRSESCEEKSFFEKSEELENLITSLSGISESCCMGNEKEDLNEGKSVCMYENRCSFGSISGLTQIKETLLNILIYPTIFPHFFPANTHWNRILLYGPPGTGKTMLAKAIATEINATLHRISNADILSHWQGETEKQIRNLFEEARSNPEPTILFFDEIDGLCRSRSQTEDDGVRRIKTELLVQFEDFVPELGNHQMYIIGATNCPWEIDSAFMRRFHKKIFIPLPDKEARLDILKKSFRNIQTDLTNSEWNEIGKKTEGYSGSDLVNVVMASCCERFLQMKKCKYWEAKGDFWVPASSTSLFLTRMNFEDIPQHKMESRNIIFADLEAGIANTPLTVGPEQLFKYLQFSAKIK